MIIEVRGVQFENKGAALMLAALCDRLDLASGRHQLALAANPQSPYPARAMLGAWQPLRLVKNRLDLRGLGYVLPPAVRCWLRQYGLITEADVDLVLDASGFSYGDGWPQMMLLQLVKELERRARRGRPYIFMPQAFGPFTTCSFRTRLGAALKKATLICARDKASFDYLAELMGDSQNLRLYPDFTNLLPPIRPAHPVPQNALLLVPNSKMVSARNPNLGWREGYLPMLSRLASAGREQGLVPVVLNHEGGADAGICDKLGSELQAQVLKPSDPREIKGIIGASRVVVASRYHACVSALSQSVPCLGTSWSHKYEALFADYGCPSDLISHCDPEQATERLRSLIAEPDQAGTWPEHWKTEAERCWQEIAQWL